MKVKVGDVVKIKNLDYCKNNEFAVGWGFGMDNCAGKIFTVKSVFHNSAGYGFDVVEIDWNFCNEWVEKILNRKEKQ